ncbi:LysR family transcriptional regulator [soil metagenome]
MVVMTDILSANIRKLDIGTLVALQRLLRERNLSRVAREVGLSQPAMSHALARVRRVFGDALLVREGAGLVLTAQGEALRLRLDTAIPELLAIFQIPEFEPERSTAVFKLGITDHAGQVLLPALLDALQVRAPNVQTSIAIIPNRQTDLAELDDGRYDLRIGWLRSLPPQWHRRKLLDDRIVLICAKDNPHVREPMTIEQFVALDHVALESDRPIYPNLIDSFLAERGLKRRVVTRISHFSLAPTIVARTNMVAMFPERLARSFGATIRIVRPPFDFPDNDLSMAWHPRVHASQGDKWLRDLVVAASHGAAENGMPEGRVLA